MKSLRIFLILILSSLLFLTGCSLFKGKKGAAGEAGSEDGSTLSEADLNAQREKRYSLGSVPLAEGEGIFRDVPFAFDSSRISDEARQDIEYNVQILKNNTALTVQLEGHCDERGTAEYNLALGSERARAVKEVLLSYGIQARRINTISYGEEVPLESGHSEEAWARNRRVHFSVYTEEKTGKY